MGNKITKLKRTNVKSINDILGFKFKVLDQGFIRVIDYMGSDDSIVQAARVSYGKGTKIISKDRSLVRYLMRNHHTSPFEMCEIKFHIKAPMDTWRQWIRHRTANVNEYSTRYSIAIDSTQRTNPNDWRIQSNLNKQGSSIDFISEKTGKKLSEDEAKLQDLARKVYLDRLNCGISREQARKDLPLSTYTEAYWKIDLHNLLHFLSLRMDSKAQFEIRSYADIIGFEIVKNWCPYSWEAFLDYRFNSIVLTDKEIKLVEQIINKNFDTVTELGIAFGFLNKDKLPNKNRERIEFEEKLIKLGIEKPW